MSSSKHPDHLVPTLISPLGKVLPPEITLYILSILEHDRSIQTLLTLQRCSRDMYHTVNSYLYRHIRLSARACAFLVFRIIRYYLSSDLPAEQVSPDHSQMITRFDEQSAHIRLQYLFTLVKKLTISYETALGISQRPDNKISRLFRKHLLFPNLESIALTDSPRTQYSLNHDSVNFLLGACQPTYFCVDRTWSKEISYSDLLNKLYGYPKFMVIHGAGNQFLPDPSQVTVRLSYRKGPTEDVKPALSQYLRGDKAHRLIDAALPSNVAYSIPGDLKWKIVARKQADYETASGILEIRTYLMQKISDIESTSQLEGEDIGLAMKKKLNQIQPFVNQLKWITNEDDLQAEPPCEACGGPV